MHALFAYLKLYGEDGITSSLPTFIQDIGKGTSKIKHFGVMLERGAIGVLDIGGMRNITARVQIVR